MSRTRWMALLCLLLAVGLLRAMIPGRGYSPGLLPSIGDIQSECVAEFPAPRSRTDVGIGEQVRCWLDRATWRDVDLCTSDDGKQSEVSDKLGYVVWAAYGLGTVYPIVTDGSAVTLTADLAEDAGTATVIATVQDSGALGEDPPIQRKKVFNVLAPTGIEILQPADQPPCKKEG